ncbi:antitoxin [Desulfonatronum lacustre]|uniref:antitoxin n=1 Tax=Desulfonatronum lacustre TaxID=66849 RepID=UPI00048C66D7|nr:AbrB/MazE/SpoVT family DNA-binding domain-containing protein [Desulfonatronum lacustre]SMP76758.1 antitoxin VapB [Desulfonatronum zhilinae]
MNMARHVRIFRSGCCQAIRIPKEFELDADSAIIRREGDRLIIEPVRTKGLLGTLATLSAINEIFPDMDSGLPPLDDVHL